MQPHPTPMTVTSRRALPHRGERGYSLVEVLIAAGLLTGVLLSISGLFIAGTQSVRSGRELTKAVTVANSALEQVLAWNYDKVYGFAGAAGTASTAEWSTASSNPAYVGSTEDILDWTATANAWRDRVADELYAGEMTYQVDGVVAYPSEGSDGLTAFVDAQFLRVTVTVSWTEARGRRRHVAFQEIVL